MPQNDVDLEFWQLPGWFRVRVQHGIAVLWIEPFPCAAPNPWIIAGPTKDAAGSVATCAFIMRADEFEREVIERIALPPSEHRPEKEFAHG